MLLGATALSALQLISCCKIFDKGSGDDVVQNDGPDPVTGDLPKPRSGFLADLGFRPKTNGFNFENGGKANFPRTPGFVGPAEMSKLFGAKDVCIGGRMVGNTCRMTPAASEFARKVNVSMNGGQCEGMAVSSLTFFKGIDQITQFAKTARSAHDVNREQVRSLIGYYFAYQFSDPVISAKMDAKRRFTPVQTMARVVELIQKGDPGVMFMRSPDNMSGHAVSPYAVEDRGNGIYWIRIYDNNWPNKERYVEIDKNMNTWKYELAAINPAVAKMPWSGDATSHNFGIVPISVRAQKIVCPFCKKTKTKGIMGDSTAISNLMITDDQGHRVGMENGKEVNEIANAQIIHLDGWVDGSPTSETLYVVPEGSAYDVDMEGKEGAKDGDVVIFSAGTAVTIENVKVAAKQKDRVSMSADGTGIRYKPAARGKIPPMKIAMDDEKAGYVVQISNVKGDDDDDDDDVQVKLDHKAGKLEIFGSGRKANKRYDLKMTRQKEDDKDDDEVVQKDNKFVKPNEAHTVSFTTVSAKKPLKLDRAVVKVKPRFGTARPDKDDKDDKKGDKDARDPKDPKKDDVKAGDKVVNNDKDAKKDDKVTKRPPLSVPPKPQPRVVAPPPPKKK